MATPAISRWPRRQDCQRELRGRCGRAHDFVNAPTWTHLAQIA